MAHGRSIAGACPPGFNVQSNADLGRALKEILTLEKMGLHLRGTRLRAREAGGACPCAPGGGRFLRAHQPSPGQRSMAYAGDGTRPDRGRVSHNSEARL